MNFAASSTPSPLPIANPILSPGMRPLPERIPATRPPSKRMANSTQRPLNEREKQVLRLVCEGMSNAEIATRVGVTLDSIKTELKRIFHKISARNRTQAAVLVVRQSML
jgi:DNA-binding NarL/FixJ family response regulator